MNYYCIEITTTDTTSKAIWGDNWDENQAMVKLHEIQHYQRQNPDCKKCVCIVIDEDGAHHHWEKYVAAATAPAGEE